MGVDIVLNGHVHAYERTAAVYKWQLDECGPVHLNLGDGGNREGAYVRSSNDCCALVCIFHVNCSSGMVVTGSLNQ